MPLKKFNFLRTPTSNRETNIGHVRVRATAIDRYAGKRGRDYIAARAMDQSPTREDDAPNTPAWLLK